MATNGLRAWLGLVEAVQTSCLLDEGFRKQYAVRCRHKPKDLANVEATRKLGLRLCRMLQASTSYPEIGHLRGRY